MRQELAGLIHLNLCYSYLRNKKVVERAGKRRNTATGTVIVSVRSYENYVLRCSPAVPLLLVAQRPTPLENEYELQRLRTLYSSFFSFFFFSFFLSGTAA